MGSSTDSGKYWRERLLALEEEQYQKSEAYQKDLQEQFRRAKNEIQMDIERWYWRLAENNGISLAAAKRLLRKKELEEFQWTVEQYIKYGERNGFDPKWKKQLENASARHHISYLEALKCQMQQHVELLMTEYEGGVTDFLHKTYTENYYHSAYEIAKGTGIGSNLAQLDEKSIHTIIKKPWTQDGKNFSERIWTNKQKLTSNLHTELSQCIIRGEEPAKAICRLAEIMDVSERQAGRLVMTEAAAISSVAKKDCFQELDVEEFQFVATLDRHTSKLCQSMDGKHFKMSDYQIGVNVPPLHCWCRSCTVPYFGDEFTEGEQRAARDEEGKTYYVSANMTYSEWKKKFVNDKKIKELQKSELNDSIKETQILNREEVILKAKELHKELLNGNGFIDEKDPNPVFEYVTRKIGYDNVPKVVSALEFDTFVRESPIGILYRGVNADTMTEVEEYVNNFKSGKLFTGIRQAYGHGIYFSPKESVAQMYKKENQHGAIICATLMKSAKIADYRMILKEYSLTKADVAQLKYKDLKERWEYILASVGEYAVLAGYDAIAMNGFNQNDHIIVLNRGKVVIKE